METIEPYWATAGVTLYHGDARDILPQLMADGLKADLVLTDPPYGDTSLAWDRWPEGWVTALRDLAPQLWCFGSARMFKDHAREFDDDGWNFSQDVVWEKHNGSGSEARKIRRVHEHVWHWYRGARWGDLTINQQYTLDATARTVRRKQRPPHWGDIGDSAYASADGGPRQLRSIIYCRSMHGIAIHPTEKPPELLERLISYSTNVGDLVVDPFGGSCSTARVALALGRGAICIEANEQYLEAAVRSLESQLALQAS